MKKTLLFQSHAASICERKNGGFITEDEAHYICSILNAPVVEGFIQASSDNRSYKVRLPVFVPLYNSNDKNHTELAQLSRKAHKNPDDIDDFRKEINRLYIEICRHRK